MYYIQGEEFFKAKGFMYLAEQEARKASCLRSKCGSVIVKDKVIIGRGYNSPPLDQILERCWKDDLPTNFKSDKTCCIHAEQRAIMDVLVGNAEKMKNSRIYFIRLDLENKIIYANEPYCTICSKMALDVGIKEFVLWHEQGIAIYDTYEYKYVHS